MRCLTVLFILLVSFEVSATDFAERSVQAQEASISQKILRRRLLMSLQPMRISVAAIEKLPVGFLRPS